MGGDFASGGSSDEEQAATKTVSMTTAVKEALKNKLHDVRLSDPFGFSPKLKRVDLEPLQKSDASFIKTLVLASNDLKDEDLEPIANLQLQTLDAHENDLHDLHALKNMQSLKSLDLGFCSINSDGIAVISQLPNLDFLNLDGCEFGAGSWKKLTVLKKLKTLQLHGCRGILPAEMEELKKELPGCAVGTSRPTATANGEHAMKADIQRIKTEIMGGGDYAEADLALAVSIDRWKERQPPPYQGLARAYRTRGDCMEKLGHWEKALAMYSQSLTIYKEHFPDSEDCADLALRCAACYSELHQYRRERALRREADLFWRSHEPSEKLAPRWRRNRQWLHQHKPEVAPTLP